MHAFLAACRLFIYLNFQSIDRSTKILNVQPRAYLPEDAQLTKPSSINTHHDRVGGHAALERGSAGWLAGGLGGTEEGAAGGFERTSIMIIVDRGGSSS